MPKLEFDNERFKDIIKANKLDTKVIAKKIGVRESSITKWISGEAVPSNGLSSKINEVLGVELFYKQREKRNKYRNNKAEVDGIKFDSRKEANRYSELKILEQAGEIKNLERQKKYLLIPSQKDENEHCIERECSYMADFVYEKDGKTIVEDTKGLRTTAYIIKRKLMLYVHGIRIQEI